MQIWSSKFTTYLHLSQTLVNPFFRPVVKAQVEGFKCVWGRRGRPGDTKATGDSKDQLGIIYAHKWLLSRSRGLKRDLETISSSQNACLWLIDSHVNFLGP